MSEVFLLTVIGILVVLIVYQHVYFLRQIHILVNKIMAGSYQGYVRAESKEISKVKIDDLPNEDLSILNDLT